MRGRPAPRQWLSRRTGLKETRLSRHSFIIFINVYIRLPVKSWDFACVSGNLQALVKLNDTFASLGLPGIAIRIGLHTGAARCNSGTVR